MIKLSELIMATSLPADSYSPDYYRAQLLEPSTQPSQELMRLLKQWSNVEAPLAMCRAYCALKHWKATLRWGPNSLGEQMLTRLEAALPGRTLEWVKLHTAGFACLLLAYDVYARTLKTFHREKEMDLNSDFKKEILQTYVLAVYHFGRSMELEPAGVRMILAGAHDSFNAFFCRPMGLEQVSARDFAIPFEAILTGEKLTGMDGRPLSPSYALVRNVFNQLGLNSQSERMTCATMLEVSAGHVLEMGEVLSLSRTSALV